MLQEQHHVADLISHLEEDNETKVEKQEIRELIDSFHEIEDSEVDDENKCPNSVVANLTLNSNNQGTNIQLFSVLQMCLIF